jgi:Ribosomal protein S9
VIFMEESKQPAVQQIEAPQAAEAKEKQTSEPSSDKPKAARRASKKASAKQNNSSSIVKAKRKASIARASIKAGSGIIRINSKPVEVIEPIELREEMLKPLYVSELTKKIAQSADIKINVNGGGISSQAQAVSSAIAKAIVAFSDTDTVRKEIMRYDRSLLIDDVRRVEPKKFLGTKARARFQTSYR